MYLSKCAVLSACSKPTSSYIVNSGESGRANPQTPGSYVATQIHTYTHINTDGDTKENRGRIGEQECNKRGKKRKKKKLEGLAREEGKSSRSRQGCQRGRNCFCNMCSLLLLHTPNGVHSKCLFKF